MSAAPLTHKGACGTLSSQHEAVPPRLKLQRVPDKFRSFDHYVSVLAPLVVEEVHSSSLQALRADASVRP